MSQEPLLDNMHQAAADAVAQYWLARAAQRDKQEAAGRTDQGARSAVTGGTQMEGFVHLFARAITEAGIESRHIFLRKGLELPGFFRPTKEWDFLVVQNGRLLAAIEAKSQVGPSFGNNFNNRTEEALGTALDVWTAFREGAFASNTQPFLGYVFMLEDCSRSNTPVAVAEPHFRVFPEFVGASYAMRYELFCRKLVRERHYTAAAFLTSRSDTGVNGQFAEPAPDLTLSEFLRNLIRHVSAYAH